MWDSVVKSDFTLSLDCTFCWCQFSCSVSSSPFLKNFLQFLKIKIKIELEIESEIELEIELRNRNAMLCRLYKVLSALSRDHFPMKEE